MENYLFTPTEIALHWRVRLHGWLAARHDNHALYQQFVTDLHLKELEQDKIGYHLPKSYLIVTSEIARFYHVRDKILLRIHHKDFAKKQAAIDDELNRLAEERTELKAYRAQEKTDLDRLRLKLKSIKQNDDRIAMESRIAKAESKLRNTDESIKECENRLARLEQTKRDNLTRWHKQVSSIEKTIELSVSDYLKAATSKIETVYGFTEFTHEIAKYDSEMLKTINGEY